jgi:hypothetical protein
MRFEWASGKPSHDLAIATTLRAGPARPLPSWADPMPATRSRSLVRLTDGTRPPAVGADCVVAVGNAATIKCTLSLALSHVPCFSSGMSDIPLNWLITTSAPAPLLPTFQALAERSATSTLRRLSIKPTAARGFPIAAARAEDKRADASRIITQTRVGLIRRRISRLVHCLHLNSPVAL